MGSANDMKAANRTYATFLTLLKYSVPVIAAITVFVIWLIA